MLAPLQYLNSVALCIALLSGMLAFRYMPRIWGLVFVQVLLATAAEIFGLYLSKTHRPNAMLYNCYIFLEILLLGSFGLSFLRGKRRWAGILLFAGTLAVNVVTLIKTRAGVFNDTAFLLNCIFLTALYLAILLMLQLSDEAGLFRQPILYLCVGSVLYFGCDIPYFSLRHYFMEHDQRLNTLLYLAINTGFATVRYLLAGFSFFLFYWNRRLQGSTA